MTKVSQALNNSTDLIITGHYNYVQPSQVLTYWVA